MQIHHRCAEEELDELEDEPEDWHLLLVAHQHYSATFLSFAGFLTPLIVSMLGYIFLGECISWYIVVAVLLVFVGLSLFYSDELGNSRACTR